MLKLEWITIGLASVLVALGSAWIYRTFFASNKIPGPWFALPVIGHFYLLHSKPPHVVFTDLSRRYGDLVRFEFGPHTAIVVSGRDTIRTVCAHAASTGRPHHLFNSWRKHQRYFAFGHSEAALKYRKATVAAISDVLKGSMTYKSCLQAICDQLINKLCSDGSEKLDQQNVVRTCVAELAFQVCFGTKESGPSDGETNAMFKGITQSVDDITTFARQAAFADTFPWSLFFPAVRNKYKLFTQAQDNLVEFVRQQESLHLEKIITANGSRDNLCDIFLKQQPEQRARDNSVVSDGSTLGSLIDQTGMLLIAGIETVSVSLNWALLLLAVHHEFQTRIYNQLIETAEDQRDSSHNENNGEDKSTRNSKSPLLEAFLAETLRFSMASQLAMPHMSLEDIDIEGKVIPKNTLLLINLWSGSRDERIWGGDAELFSPDRFLDEHGNVNRRLEEEIVAFGSGRRRCVGEQLARAELYFFLQQIITRCELRLPRNVEACDIDYWSNGAGRNKAPAIPLRFITRS